MTARLLSFIGCMALLGTISQASGTPLIPGGTVLPGATYSGSLSLNSSGSTGDTSTQNVTGPGTISGNVTASVQGTPNGASASGSIAISIGQSPSLSLTATDSSFSTPPVLGSGQASFDLNPTLNYSMEIFGPTTAVAPVSVRVDASGGVSVTYVTGTYLIDTMQAEFYVIDPHYNTTIYDALNLTPLGPSYSGPTSQNFTDTNTYTLKTRTLYSITLTAILSSTIYGSTNYGIGGGTETLSAFVDPRFFVVSPNPNDYAILFSPNVGIGATPLPAAFPLFVTGLGAFGLLGWRRKRKAALAA